MNILKRKAFKRDRFYCAKGCVFPYIGIAFTCYSASAKVTFALCVVNFGRICDRLLADRFMSIAIAYR